MIVHKQWITEKRHSFGGLKYQKLWEGWFLFGLIPLYVRLVKWSGDIS